MQSQDCLPHDPGEEKDLIDLFFCWGLAGFVLNGDGDLCSEEPFLLLFRRTPKLSYQKCIRNSSHSSSSETLVFETAKETVSHA